MIDIPSNPPVAMALDGHVGIVEVQKPPHNFFDQVMLSSIADAFETFETNPLCRAIVLCAQGTSFCAGADFSKRDNAASGNTHRSPRAVNPIYGEAVRLFAATKPVICAVQGPAIGGGLGLAMVGDFRVACPEARFAANFNRLGFHPGFGLSVTLPRVVGMQKAQMMFFTGRRIGGEEALAMGLADVLVPREQVREEALKLACEIAISAPLAVQSTRATIRAGLVEAVRSAVAHESIEQSKHYQTEDFKEGIAASAARRDPAFKGV
jgi:enoyl-CoA hydratase/carnithine racemase